MIGSMLGAYLNWRFVAARLREATGTGDGQGGALTLPAFFAQRSEGSPRSRRAVRALATILILFFFTFYVSAGLAAGARLLRARSACLTSRPCSWAPERDVSTPWLGAFSPWPGRIFSKAS